MIVTIDGPAGTGKSSVARAVAERLGLDFLDTGAMYRAIGLEALRRGTDLEDHRELAFVASHCRIEFDWSTRPPGVLLNGERVDHAIRSADATRAASWVAVVPAVREKLVEQQKQIGANRGSLVSEGRDQGTVVFPQAELKFYLDATPQERAHRRAAQLRSRGEMVDVDELLKQIIERDQRDRTRAVGPMVAPPDAEQVDTTNMNQEQVIEYLVERIKSRLGQRS